MSVTSPALDSCDDVSDARRLIVVAAYLISAARRVSQMLRAGRSVWKGEMSHVGDAQDDVVYFLRGGR